MSELMSRSSHSSEIRTSPESAQLIADYIRENGRLPILVASHVGEQKRLAVALIRLRSLKRRGQLSDDATQILDDAHPGWAEGASIHSARLWQARVNELVAWVERHGRTPHWAAGDSAERAFAAWVATYRRHSRHGRHPDRIKELDERVPIWRRPPTWKPKT